MAEPETDPKRQPNPAARRDAPVPPAKREGDDEPAAPVRPTQGRELNPRDQGGIAE
jgi:hypothetical protein